MELYKQILATIDGTPVLLVLVRWLARLIIPHPDAQGRKCRYIARTPEELYPDRPDLRDARETLPGGWLVATNLNNILKKTIMKLAAEVAGLVFGKDVIVEF